MQYNVLQIYPDSWLHDNSLNCQAHIFDLLFAFVFHSKKKVLKTVSV